MSYRDIERGQPLSADLLRRMHEQGDAAFNIGGPGIQARRGPGGVSISQTFRAPGATDIVRAKFLSEQVDEAGIMYGVVCFDGAVDTGTTTVLPTCRLPIISGMRSVGFLMEGVQPNGTVAVKRWGESYAYLDATVNTYENKSYLGVKTGSPYLVKDELGPFLLVANLGSMGWVTPLNNICKVVVRFANQRGDYKIVKLPGGTSVVVHTIVTSAPYASTQTVLGTTAIAPV